VTDEVPIRPLEKAAELRACEDLQMEVWGYTEREVVPKNELLAAVRSGGSLLGAWQGETLLGFSYGMAGLDARGVYLSSRLVAVKTGQRSQGLGEALKRAQRRHALDLGYRRIRWTQDALQAANARLNLRKLGATARSYVLDYYGTTSSPLHGSLPTDRLELEWDLESPRVKRRLGEAAGVDPLSVAAAKPETASLLDALPGALARPSEPREVPERATQLFLAIPPVVGEILERDPGLALAWRLATRTAFQRAFARGFEATDFVSTKGAAAEARYVLTRAAG
jgi:predicted GNAT superfamily acetyltransferase